MIYFAHRGASAQAPANSVEAFRLARTQGATCYELDVHATRDGRLLVQHDYDWVAGGQPWPVRELAWADLVRRARQTGGRPPALLEEIFPAVREGLELLNIEIKNDDQVYPGIETLLWRLLNRAVPELLAQILISSFDFETLLRLRRQAPQARIGLLTRALQREPLLTLAPYSVHINQTRITRPGVELCHQHGCRVFVYTVNDPVRARELEALGVDGIFTDRPDLFLSKKPAH